MNSSRFASEVKWKIAPVVVRLASVAARTAQRPSVFSASTRNIPASTLIRREGGFAGVCRTLTWNVWLAQSRSAPSRIAPIRPAGEFATVCLRLGCHCRSVSDRTTKPYAVSSYPANLTSNDFAPTFTLPAVMPVSTRYAAPNPVSDITAPRTLIATFVGICGIFRPCSMIFAPPPMRPMDIKTAKASPRLNPAARSASSSVLPLRSRPVPASSSKINGFLSRYA